MTHGVSHLEIFNPQLPDSLKSVHASAAVSRTFDPVCKCYLLSLLNTGQIQLPKEPHRLLSISMQYLVLQIYIPTGKSFTLEVAFSDLTNTKRRIVLANTRDIVRSQMHVRVPNYRLKREVWMNLCVDLATSTKIFFPGCVFKCLDQVRVGAVCKLRRMFCMRNRILDTTGDPDAEAKQYSYDIVPPAMEFPKTVRSINQFVDSTDCRLPDEKLCATEPRVGRKSKDDFLPDISENLFIRKHRSLNVRSTRKPPEEKREIRRSQWPEPLGEDLEPEFTQAPEIPRKQESLPMAYQFQSAKPPLAPASNRSIFQSPDSASRSVNRSPEYFQFAFQGTTEVRHFTPPFVNVTSEGKATPLVRYDPVLRAYDPGLR